MTPVLLFLIAALLPWTVHLAPPRQRPLALVMMVAVLMLFGIFVKNPLTALEFWGGIVAGVVTIVAYGMFGTGGRRTR